MNFINNDSKLESNQDAKVHVETVDNKLDAIIKDTLTRQELHIGGHFTGPKGVLADFSFHKSLELERAKESSLKQSESLASVATSSGWLERQVGAEAAGATNNTFPVLSGIENSASDPAATLMQNWRSQRLAELSSMPSLARKTFGHVLKLKNQDEFLQAIDLEPVTTFVIIHLYEDSCAASRLVNKYLPRLAQHYPYHKFATLQASIADPNIDIDIALPVIQCYRRGELVANLVRFTDEMDTRQGNSTVEHFEWEDLEDLLMQHGVISIEDLVQPLEDFNSENVST